MSPDLVSRQRSSKAASRGAILAVVLVYAIFASCWILLSDKLVQLIFTKPDQIILVSILKGWVFVVVTSLLLYYLMRSWVVVDSAPVSITHKSLRSGWIFILLAVVIVIFTGASILSNLRHHRKAEIADLDAKADIKAAQIADWFRERQNNLDFILTSEYMAEQYRNWQESGDVRSAEKMKTRLEQFRKISNFSAITLLDSQGNKLWGSAKAPDVLSANVQAVVHQVAKDHKPRQLKPYIDASKDIRLDFIAQLNTKAVQGALFILHINLADSLFPLLQIGSIKNNGIKVLLFRRDSDQVLYINEFKDRNNRNAQLRVLDATEKRFTAQVKQGGTSPGSWLEDQDYQGVHFIGVVRAVPGTDWLLVLRQDFSVFYAESVEESVWPSLVGVFGLFVVGAGFYRMQQAQQLAVAQAVQQSQSERLHALQLLAAIADSSNDAIYAKDLDGRYILFNRAAGCFINKSVEEVLGHDDSYLFPAEQAEMLRLVDRQVFTDNSIHTQEEMLSTAQGECVFLATKGPMRDADGKTIGIFGISRDITERKRAELALGNSERRFRQLFDLAPMPLVIVNEIGVIVSVNTRFVDTFGYTLSDVPTLDTWWPLAYPDPDYRRMVMASWGTALAYAKEQGADIPPKEYRVTCKSGEVRAMVISGILIGTDFLVTFFDVTERRAAEDALHVRERYLRAVLDNFPFMVWLKDTDSRILAVNKTYARVANVFNPDELIGKTDMDCWEQALAEHYRLDDQAVLDSGLPKTVEEEITEADRRFWIETYKSPVQLDGRIIGTVGFARDITERREAEIELRRRNDELDRFNQAMIGRELDMIALKQQVNALSRELGLQPPYSLAFLDAPPVAPNGGEAS